MVKTSISLSIALCLSFGGLQLNTAHAKTFGESSLKGYRIPFVKSQVDTSEYNAKTDTIGQMVKALQKFKNAKDTINIREASAVPNLSLQQIAKGHLAGLYVQEPNGEPGTEQSMIVQGPSGILFSKKDVHALQPAVYLNGVPLVADNPFAFDVQKYDYNRVGPANNLLAQINISNIESVVLVKDPFELAKLGPNAANGALYITTKNAKAGIRDISLNTYFGYATAPKVNTVNGVYENNFRRPFYEKYGNQQRYDDYALYLRDSTNTAYFGPSNWNDLYYKNTPTYSADLGITGGNERANFRFFGSGTKNAGNADETNINRYNVFFGINMAPFKWLTVSSNVNAVRLDRNRNKSLRDRFAETRYIPDLSTPLSPNKDNFGLYLYENKKNVDNNRTTSINGNLTLSSKLNRFSLQSSLFFDYNEGIRDYFTPSTLMDGVSYISTYFGYNQRMIWNNTIGYDFDLGDDHSLDLEVGHVYQGDTYKYNYARAYNGPNDYVKLVFVDPGAQGDSYLNALNAGNFYVFRYIDKELNNLLSIYGSAKYSYKDIFKLNAMVRRDGSSNGQPDSRWMTTPAVSMTYNLKDQLFAGSSFFNQLELSTGWGRNVRIFLDDRYAAGPQYRSESGWYEEPTIPGYGGVLGINRPYESGFIGYGIKLPYADRTNISLDGTFLNNRMNAAISVYNRNDKNQLVGVPVPLESGYSVNYKSGLEVNNKGIEFLLNGQIIQNPESFNWRSSINFNYNKNEVTALPDGYKEIINGDNRLEVGKPVTSYWIYKNQGIYNTDADVPAGHTFNGIPLFAGDPQWADLNNDNRIDTRDKVMEGNRLPSLIGGWSNTFAYKNFDLNFHFFFATGHKILNQYQATKYDFIKREASNDITSVKEVSSWQSFEKEKTYPIYNPWSDVNAYRVDQDLFLEDASYLKLRSVTLGYDFKNASFLNSSSGKFRRVYLYATALNVLTFTKFTGVDPELSNYNGLYDGANLTIPRTFVLGLKLDL
ncbi:MULTISPECIES: SusC/RagA family TonB-linked outer membrane protein [Sphingobacterium]|uniref:SusC/RagA family TonB-linked outer membrane protein n=1 Tax=Sphingobacterium litopenaei TaxID=2763500 RepID=A0ABR7YGX5_9SPHI|nr:MULTISPECIES: SusC/RagA family TonB-linked outer membrane protein [Sphingobacterium]MBD1430572.1 SusC/RagA family TonB-linked outer membrane protein [Sphingobacterium litopenaei]NGM73625.1 SusC/RagA family TonB-linked outer membrane protein [Sphingobacterium sp. SGL-16]